MSQINSVVINGNLTKDPELKPLPSGSNVCEFSIAHNTRKKGPSGEYEEYVSYFDVSVYGKQAENCKQYLFKGRPVNVHAILEQQRWTQDGQPRQKVVLIARDVQFLNPSPQQGQGQQQAQQAPQGGFTPQAQQAPQGGFSQPPQAPPVPQGGFAQPGQQAPPQAQPPQAQPAPPQQPMPPQAQPPAAQPGQPVPPAAPPAPGQFAGGQVPVQNGANGNGAPF